MTLKVHPGEVEQVKLTAVSHFLPMVLKEALRRMCGMNSSDCLKEFEQSMVDLIDRMHDDQQPNFETMKEFAIAELHLLIKDVQDNPETKKPVENISDRRTLGRSEVPATLEEQLQHGLEDSFPASDPPAVTTTTIPGKAKEPT